MSIDLLKYACSTVADAMGWRDLEMFSRLDLPAPCAFVLHDRYGECERTMLVMHEDRGMLVRAVERRGRELQQCDRLVSVAAMRSLGGDYGEIARVDAVARFQRLRDIDLAENKAPAP